MLFFIRKKRKNIVDFTDIEHFALDILLKKQEDGTVKKQRLQRGMKKNLKKLQQMNTKTVIWYKNIF